MSNVQQKDGGGESLVVVDRQTNRRQPHHSDGQGGHRQPTWEKRANC